MHLLFVLILYGKLFASYFLHVQYMKGNTFYYCHKVISRSLCLSYRKQSMRKTYYGNFILADRKVVIEVK